MAAATKKQCFLRFLYWTDESSPPSFKVCGLQMTINLALVEDILLLLLIGQKWRE